MFCANCGEPAPPEANYCPTCGTEITEPDPSAGTSTLAIELDREERHHLEDLPPLPPGTGMLVVVRGPSVGARFLLDRDLTTIGRHPESDLFLDDVTVSRRHAEIQRGEDGDVITDQNSLNGTYVGGQRTEQSLLHPGAEIQVGRFKLVYVAAGSV